jgi:hypothetical protein
MIAIGFDFDRVDEKFIRKENHQILINEAQDSGEAALTVTFPNTPDLTYYKLCEEHTAWLHYAVNKKCADGIIIQINQLTYEANIYVFELKSSLSYTTWSKVLKQFRGALLRAISLCNTVGIKDIKEVFLYTSFTDSSILDSEMEAIKKQQSIQGFAARKQFVGVKNKEIIEWGKDTIKLFPDSQDFSHKKILLTNQLGINIGSYVI